MRLLNFIARRPKLDTQPIFAGEFRLSVLRLTFASAVFTLAVSPVLASAQVPLAPTAAAHAAGDPLRLFSDSRMITGPRISVEVVGSGRDIILIPGLASSRETWRRTAERLRARYRVHLVQVAGFAGEPPRANATGAFFEPVLADIDAYAAGLRTRPIVMGHSLGGTLGLAMAERHPEHLSRLLIVDALPFFGVVMGGPSATVETVRPMAQAMRAQMRGRMPEAMARRMMAQMVTAPADVDRVIAWSMASEPSVVASATTDDMLADLRPGLASVRTPVTVLYESALEAFIQAGYATLGPKTLVVIPDSKHFIMYDQPTRFDAEVDAFLRR